MISTKILYRNSLNPGFLIKKKDPSNKQLCVFMTSYTGHWPYLQYN